jgi:hypothetical protein
VDVSKDPGYIRASHSKQISRKDDTDVSLLKNELGSPALWAGCWGQLCPTCKVCLFVSFLFPAVI